MIKVTSEAEKVSVAKAKEAGQHHIFDGWDDLPREAQKGVIGQIESLDFQLMKALVHQCFRGKGQTIRTLVLKPADIEPLPSADSDPTEYRECRRCGEEAIAAGKVALVMASGGAPIGPLGEPVGFLPIGPVTGKSVFQLHAEKVRALNRRHKVSLRWWIVTHPETHEQISSFFKKENLFRLSSTDTIFLPQPLLPLVDRRGKFVLTEPGRLATEPNGHGGVLLEFLKEEKLDEFKAKGIEHVFFFQVDNPLVQVADPVFIGHHILKGAEVSAKAVPKTHPEEQVGIFCRIGGTPGVVEYSDLGEEDQKQTRPDGRLTFNHGNMAVHVLSVEFFRRMAEENVRLPFHTRERTVPCLDKRGQKARPTEPNCIQFRFYLFDALRVAQRVNIVEVDREKEFSPIKYNGGDNSPLSAQRDLSRMYARWLRSSGATFKNPGSDDGLIAVEISPLYALDEEELKSKIELPLEIDQDLCLGARS